MRISEVNNGECRESIGRLYICIIQFGGKGVAEVPLMRRTHIPVPMRERRSLPGCGGAFAVFSDLYIRRMVMLRCRRRCSGDSDQVNVYIWERVG